jgi:hypothetical protein
VLIIVNNSFGIPSWVAAGPSIPHCRSHPLTSVLPCPPLLLQYSFAALDVALCSSEYLLKQIAIADAPTRQ